MPFRAGTDVPDLSLTLPTTAFGYRTITIERPLRLRVRITPDRLAQLAVTPKLLPARTPPEEQAAWLTPLHAALLALPHTEYADCAAFAADLAAALKPHRIKLTDPSTKPCSRCLPSATPPPRRSARAASRGSAQFRRGGEVKQLKYLCSVSNHKLTNNPYDMVYIGLENILSGVGKLQLDLPVEEVKSTVSLFNASHVLFGKLRPYLAKVFWADVDGAWTTELLVLEAQDRAANHFLNYMLLAQHFLAIVNSSTYGTKMPRANWEQMRGLPLPLPPLDEQRAIAAYLDAETPHIDAVIERTRAGIALLHEYCTALISAAVTGQIDGYSTLKKA